MIWKSLFTPNAQWHVKEHMTIERRFRLKFYVEIRHGSSVNRVAKHTASYVYLFTRKQLI